MALGIDIYRSFQTVTSWPKVKAAGVTYVYVKLSDGGGTPVGGRGDNEVNGAKSVGIPVGGYHFVQANPGASAQADILINEVVRLGATGCVPMLDLEDNPAGSKLPNIPDSQKRGFATAFCQRVAARGFRPGVYMNNALAKTLRPDQWGIPNLVIWIARYGARPDAAAGRYDLHQYSSSGSIAGITASGVDLDESYTSNHLTTEAPDMDDNQAAQLAYVYTVLKRYPDSSTGGETQNGAAAYDAAENTRRLVQKVTALGAKVDGLVGAVAALATDPGLDAATVRQIVTDAVQQSIHITGTVAITGSAS
jgi:GH25 family lysozyme M1 (1,4-beta-N-acetylmuramidase)